MLEPILIIDEWFRSGSCLRISYDQTTQPM